MSTQRVRIRFVPRTKTEIPIVESFGAKSISTSKDFRPSQDKAKEALRRVLNLGVDAKLTEKNSITAELDPAQAQHLFASEVVEVETSRGLDASFTLHESHLSTKEEIQLPDELKNLIEFAYVPSAPEFFAPTFYPPKITHHYLDLQDVVRALNGSKCHRKGWTGRGVKVAMTDTGFARHPYFESQGYLIERVPTEQTSLPQVDTSGHGTGESANVLALAPDCHFVGIKHDDYSALALETALQQQPKIITNSWGWNIDRHTKEALKTQDRNLYFEMIDLENIILDAIDDGIVVVFAGGNGQLAFPACIPEVIAVGGVSVDLQGGRMASNYASSFISRLYPGRGVPDFCGIVGQSGHAPQKGHIMLPVPSGSELEGSNMPSNKQHLGWGIFSGTSAAAPQIAGCIALMLSVNPELTPFQIKTILANSSVDVTKGSSIHAQDAGIGQDQATGAGLVDAFAACEMALGIHHL